MSLFKSLNVEEKKSSTDLYSASFIFRQLPRGLGITLGNCLRQVLLTNLAGIAPLGVEIIDKNGSVTSQFSTLEGVRETTQELILNLKKIIFAEKKKKDGIFCLEMRIENKTKKEKIITASDFEENKDSEIQNPELYLATLAPLSRLEVRLYCRKNWGYHQAQEQKKDLEDKENVIILDSDYSPTKGGLVKFQTESEVISLSSTEETLILDITTNGSITPQTALLESLKVLNDCSSDIKNKLIGKNK